MSKQLKCYAWYEWVFTALYMIRWIICPILLSPPGKIFVTNFETGKSRYNFLATNFLHISLGWNCCDLVLAVSVMKKLIIWTVKDYLII